MRLRTLAIGLGLVCAAPVLAFLGVRHLIGSADEITDTELRIDNLAGADFEVTYTNFDGIAKDEWMSVYVSKAKPGPEPWYRRWSNRRELLFRYDPGNYRERLPAIRESGSNRIRISVPRVSAIFCATKSWRNLSVEYDIGQVFYPTAGAQRACEH